METCGINLPGETCTRPSAVMVSFGCACHRPERARLCVVHQRMLLDGELECAECAEGGGRHICILVRK
jgi:hypothetical protein